MANWSLRVSQTFYKEWACEVAGRLIGKVRNSMATSSPFIGEIYINGRTHVVYRGDNEQMARGSVAQYA